MQPRKGAKVLQVGENIDISKGLRKSARLCSRNLKFDDNNTEESQLKKRNNFVSACELVSRNAYYNQCSRLLLSKLPQCIEGGAFKHEENKHSNLPQQMMNLNEQLFNIEIKSYMWLDALHICDISITTSEYLSAYVLKKVIEIMMNAHDDVIFDNKIKNVLENCQKVLVKNFTIHPPCATKVLRKCYKEFLTSPIDPLKSTFSNMNLFEHDKGIVKYCFNRLENEISIDGIDGPIIDRYVNTPEDMRRTPQGMHWQKDHVEIYESLERHDRIERLMAVLKHVILPLQLDLVTWQSKYRTHLGNHMMRPHKPLMASILWSDNVLCTGAVNSACRQIIRIFIYVVHLRYPKTHIKIMLTWLNTMIQTFYICETDSNINYPNVGKYSTTFANQFCKIIADMPPASVVRILQRIKPSFMKMLIATQHVKALLSTKENCIVKILIDFIKDENWKKYSDFDTEIYLSEHSLESNIHDDLSCEMENFNYPKLDTDSMKNNSEISLNIIVQMLYVALEAYLAAYNVQRVEEKVNSLNEKSQHKNKTPDALNSDDTYYVTEKFVKKYVYIFKVLKELIVVFQEKSKELPHVMLIFKNLGLLDF